MIKKTKVKLIVGILVLLVSIFSFQFLYAKISSNINYQGKLKDSTGNPIIVPTTIQFSLYSHITNGTPTDISGAGGPLLWTETYDGSGGCAQITPGVDGIFAQHLGDCISFPDYVDFTEEYYLGVKIGGDAEASPRVPLASHPYAFTSKRLYTDGEDITITTASSGDIILNAIGDILIHDTNNEIGLPGQVLSSTGSGVDWVNATTTPWDNDHDTGIQVEEGIDDDTIRFDTFGEQRAKIDNNGNVLFSNTDSVDLVNPGALTGMLFRNDKHALRLGEVQNNEWDDVNIGNGSFSSGRNNIVSGNYSTAFGGGNNVNDVYANAFGRYNTVSGSYGVAGGFQNTASGYASTVFGQTNQVSDTRSTAWGLDNIASEREATAWGRNTEANAPYATSWGRDTIASGEHSTAFGYQNIASNDYGLAFGYRNTVSGRYATGWGGQNTASGQYSTTWGSHNTASGAHSTAFGYYSTASAENGTAIGDSLANSNYMTAIGRFNENVAGQSLENWIDTDQLFVIGNGSGWQDANRSNALTILKNGTITAPTFSLAEINTAGDTALTTKEYVDSVSGANNIYTADGTLTNDRVVTFDNNDLEFSADGDESDFTVDVLDTVNGNDGYLNITPMDISLIASNQAPALGVVSIEPHQVRIYENNINYESEILIANIGLSLEHTNSTNHTSQFELGGDSTVYTSDINSEGITYATDYSAGFVDRSLVDKEYVDGAISSSNPTFQDVVDRSIALNGSAFADFGSGEIDDDGAQLRVVSHVGFDFVFGADNMLTFSFDGASQEAKIIDERAGAAQVGMEYNADYSANFTNRSLVDKEYVDDAITSVNSTASNGLTKIGNDIQLGGTLTQDARVNADGNRYIVENASLFGMHAGTLQDYSMLDMRQNYAFLKLEVDGGIDNPSVNLDPGSLKLNMGNDQAIELSGASMLIRDENNFQGLIYDDNYSTGFVDRSLVDKEYVDNAIVVAGSTPWSKTGTNLSPTTAGDDILLNAGETLSITSLTQGSMLFIGAGGLVSQDNSNLFWDDGSSRLGVGTDNPAYKLEVAGALMLEDMAAPAASAGHSGIYSNAGELYALDDAGNSTLLSPHDEKGLWHYDSTNFNTGKTLNIKMESLSKELNKILGGGYITENNELIDEGDNLIDYLELRTSKNVSSLSNLQESVDDNLLEVGEALNSLNNLTETNVENILANKNSVLNISNNINSLSEISILLNDAISEQDEKIAMLENRLDNLGNEDDALVGEKSILTKISQGVRNIIEKVVFTAEVQFKEIAVFMSEAVFSDKVKFEDRVSYQDKDMAGSVTIKKGDKKTEVEFVDEFEIAPFVTATANNNYYAFKVYKITKSGFEIKVEEKAEKDLLFTWHALAVDKKQKSLDEEEKDNDSEKEKEEDLNDNEEINNTDEDENEEEKENGFDDKFIDERNEVVDSEKGKNINDEEQSKENLKVKKDDSQKLKNLENDKKEDKKENISVDEENVKNVGKDVNSGGKENIEKIESLKINNEDEKVN